MKPALTDEEIDRDLRVNDDPELPLSQRMYAQARRIERLTRERMMELVCAECGEGANYSGLFVCGHLSLNPITRAEYLLREEER